MSNSDYAKKLAYLLRHCTDPMYISLDGGWADVAEILKALQIDKNVLDAIVRDDKNKRYSYDETETKIRANRGHTIPGVEIREGEVTPPPELYYATSVDSLELIRSNGFIPERGELAQLFTNFDEALEFGKQSGIPVVYLIKTQEIDNKNKAIVRAPDGSWMVRRVSIRYLHERYAKESVDKLRYLLREIRKMPVGIVRQLMNECDTRYEHAICSTLEYFGESPICRD